MLEVVVSQPLHRTRPIGRLLEAPAPSSVDNDLTCKISHKSVPVQSVGKEDYVLCIPLHDIFNCILSTGKYPDLWKMSQIVPIPKVSQPSVCKDFRPISLLFHLGKLAEQVVINKLKGVLSDAV